MTKGGNFRKVSFSALLFSRSFVIRLRLYYCHLHMFGEERGGDIRGGVPGPALARGGAARQPARRHRLVPTCPNIFTDYSKYFLVIAGDLCVCGGSSTRRRPPAAGLRRRGWRGGGRGCPRLRAPAPAAWRAGRSSPGPGHRRYPHQPELPSRGRILCNTCSKRSLSLS